MPAETGAPALPAQPAPPAQPVRPLHVARPVRSAVTVAAILIGVATVTFALGLHDSLTMVASAISRDRLKDVPPVPANVARIVTNPDSSVFGLLDVLSSRG